jgi:hypothetical protein
MIKTLTKILSILLTVVIIIIFYLSFFGISTKHFNDEIKSQVSNINKTINLELKDVKLLLNVRNLTINVKTFEPKIFISNNKLELKHIKTNISLKSFINKNFSIDDLQISTKKVKLNNLILLVRSFDNSPQLFILDKIVKDGHMVGDIDLNFDSKGKIKDDYEINGFIKKAKLGFLKKYSIDDLSLVFNIRHKKFNLKDINTSFNKIRLSLPSIKVENKNKRFLISGKLINDKNDINIRLLNDLLGSSFEDHSIEKIVFSSENDFDFDVNKNLKINNFNLESKVKLKELVYKNDFLKIKNYLPDFEDSINLEDHKISIDYKKNQLVIDGKGKVTVKDKVDSISYKINKKGNQYNFNTNININKNLVSMNILQYDKKENTDSLLKLKGVYNKNKKINFEQISLNENKNNFLIKDLNLDNNFDILDVNELSFNYVNKNKIHNQINIKKRKKDYQIYGESVDASKLIGEILNSEQDNNSSSIFSNFNTTLNIKFNKAYLDEETYVNDLIGIIEFKDDKVEKLDLESFFPNNRKLTFTINTNKDNEKITTLFSDFPKPLVKQYKFIKGFEEGVLDFYSTKKNDISDSVLKIDDFKLQEVPVLAKILTLASLQGIADLLTGEGIRFTDFEMKFSNKKGLMTINEMYAIGPAISILMDGYIETKKLISLRGTLVPATTINKTIASIPLIGDFLVGKKVGEGVFGVSFKVKGPPKDLKTSVNPIKTLTPRFITRTLEKIKKN